MAAAACSDDIGGPASAEPGRQPLRRRRRGTRPKSCAAPEGIRSNPDRRNQADSRRRRHASQYEARRGWLALIAEEVEVSGATRFIREGHSLRDAIKLAGGDEALLADHLNRTIRVLLGDDSIALWCLGWDGMDNTWDDVVVTRMIRKRGTPR